jgi:hypothetical protein
VNSHFWQSLAGCGRPHWAGLTSARPKMKRWLFLVPCCSSTGTRILDRHRFLPLRFLVRHPVMGSKIIGNKNVKTESASRSSTRESRISSAAGLAVIVSQSRFDIYLLPTHCGNQARLTLKSQISFRQIRYAFHTFADCRWKASLYESAAHFTVLSSAARAPVTRTGR